MMIALEIKNLRLETGRTKLDAELEARLVGLFTIANDEGSIYVEDDFPCLELAIALRRWLIEGALANEDFEFDSMSFEEPGVVFIRLDESGWRFGSIFDPNRRSEGMSLEIAATLILGFCEQLVLDAPKEVRARVAGLLERG